MDNFENLAEEASSRLYNIEDTRNKTMQISRLVIRSTKKVIHSIHLGNPDNNALHEMEQHMTDLIKTAGDESCILDGNIVQDAMMEYAETKIFIATVNDKPVPSFLELNISPQAWSMGLCDSLGELRRLLLTSLMDSDMDTTKKLFKKMEELSDAIMTFDVPDAIVPLRRKQDISRGVMEKTRSDVMMAKLMFDAEKSTHL